VKIAGNIAPVSFAVTPGQKFRFTKTGRAVKIYGAYGTPSRTGVSWESVSMTEIHGM
jgi:hypothetical protein